MYDDDGKPIKYPECPPGFTPRATYREWLKTQKDQEIYFRKPASIMKSPPESVVEIPDPDDLVEIAVLETTLPPPVTNSFYQIGPSYPEFTRDFAAGKYYVFVTDCSLVVDGKYTAGVELEYRSNGQTVTRLLPDFFAPTREDAQNAYKYLTIQIKHDGGPITARFAAKGQHLFGSTTISIVYKQEAVLAERQLLNEIEPPNVPTRPHEAIVLARLNSCRISAQQLRWLERCWKLRDCVGVIIKSGVQQYVVIYRADMNLACPEDFGEVAVLWPVIDGTNFVPPAAENWFSRNEVFEAEVLGMINNGSYSNKVGNLKSIKKIIVPANAD
jgi:hypothetical protein